MDHAHIAYLKVIGSQLRGPIRAAAPDRMATYLIDCSFAMLTRMVVEHEQGEALRTALIKTLADNHEALQSVLGAAADGRALLADIAQLSTSTSSHAQIDAVAARTAAFLIGGSSAESQRLASLLVNTDADNWQRVREAVNSLRAAAAGGVERETEPMTAEEQQRLLELLRRECAESASLSISHVGAIPGGYSKQTIIVTLSNNRVLPREIVVRRDRAESPVGSSVVDELALLQLVHDCGIRVPKPWALDRGAVMGNPIIVMSKVEGRTISEVYDVHEPDERCALDLAEQLAILHRIPSDRVLRARPDMPGLEVSNIDYMRQQLEEYTAHWRTVGEPSVTMDASAAWMATHLDWAETAKVLVHRDPRFHNILCENGHITALLDWELAMFSHPARDLGWSYHQVIQMTDWKTFIAHYLKCGGVACSPESLAFYALWSDWYCAIQMYRARHLFHAGKAPFAYAFAGEEMRQANVHSVASLLRRIVTVGRL